MLDLGDFAIGNVDPRELRRRERGRSRDAAPGNVGRHGNVGT